MEEAGVSTAVVSYVLNKTCYVSDELTDKVNKTIKKLNYHPNVIAGSLRQKNHIFYKSVKERLKWKY